VAALWAAGYDPRAFIERSPTLAEALDLIGSGFFSLGERDRFKPIVSSLRDHDAFMVCADFDGYVACEAAAGSVYRQPRDWSRRAVLNIAGASRFSSDNTIRQYAEEIWKISSCRTDLGLLDGSR
jgi:glycogen phosphorylase